MFSAELYQALDVLESSVSRKILELLLNGEQEMNDIYHVLDNDPEAHSHFIVARTVKALERSRIVQIIEYSKKNTISKIKLTEFGKSLIENLLTSQKILTIIVLLEKRQYAMGVEK
jgi:DNA-binding HxlR family transcriptional regulator